MSFEYIKLCIFFFFFGGQNDRKIFIEHTYFFNSLRNCYFECIELYRFLEQFGVLNVHNQKNV